MVTRFDSLPAVPGSGPGISSRSVLAAVFKDWWKIAAAFSLTFGAAAALAYLMAPKYTATASLYVKFGREYTYRADSLDRDSEPVAQSFERDQIIKSEVKLLLAPDLADEVVAELGIARLYPAIAAAPPVEGGLSAKDAARTEFLHNLDAEADRDSSVVDVTFRNPDAQVAAEALNALVAAYLAKRRPLFTEARAHTLEPETAEAKRRLDEAEDALARFRLDRNILAFGTQRDLLLQQGSALDRDMQAVANELAASGERVARLRASLGETPRTVVLQSETQNNLALVDARKTLVDLRVRESELAAEYLDEARPLRDVRRSISQVQRLIGELESRPESSVRTGQNPVHETLAAQFATAEAEAGAVAARHGSVAGQLAEARARLDALAAEERELDELTRRQALAASNYANLARKLDEMRVLDKLASADSANVRVYQPARVPPLADDPRLLVLAVGFVAAALAGLLVAFVSDLLRSGFITPEQLERSTGLPVLASVPLRHRHQLPVARPW